MSLGDHTDTLLKIQVELDKADRSLHAAWKEYPKLVEMLVIIIRDPLNQRRESEIFAAIACLGRISFKEIEQVQVVLPVLPLLMKHLSASSSAVREHTLAVLANLAADSPQARQQLPSLGIVKDVAGILRSGTSPMRALTYGLLSSLIKPPSDSVISREIYDARIHDIAFESMNQYATLSDDDTRAPETWLVAEILWFLVYLSSMDEWQSTLQDGTFLNILTYLISQFDSSEVFRIPVTRIIGNLVTGQIHPILSTNIKAFAQSFLAGLSFESQVVIKESLWALSELAQKSREVAEMIFNTEFMSTLLSLFLSPPSSDIEIEAGFCLLGVFTHFSMIQCPMFVSKEREILRRIVSVLVVPDAESIFMGLRFADTFMSQYPRPRGLIVAEESDLISAIENCREFSQEAYIAAEEIIRVHFTEDYDPL
jgi:hypothetical protein